MAKEPTVTTPEAKENPDTARLGKLKLSFLYVLIGGLVVSALISVFAILIGEFNDIVQKALLTTFSFVIHSLLVLTVVSADRYNQLGRSLLPTTIIAVIMANMFSSTFGIWQIWAADASWKAFLVYIVAIGAAFLITGALKLRVAHTATRALVYATVAFVSLLAIALVPWIALGGDNLADLYYRVVGALTILSATSLSVAVIVRRIATGQNSALLKTVPAKQKTSGGMLAILITVGIIVAFFWFIGLFAFVIQSIQSSFPQDTHPYYYEDTYYDGRFR